MANAQVENFRKQYQDVAAEAGRSLGVSPDVLLSQWGLETGWGKSVIKGSNNLGNIKDFSGGGVAATDNMTGSKDKYRTYNSPSEFAADYVSLIKRKYPAAVGANDPVAFASALKAGGYAEDPNYVKSVAGAYSTITGTPAQDVEVVQNQPVTPEVAARSFSETAQQRVPATAEIKQRSYTELPVDVNAARAGAATADRFTPYEKTIALQAQATAAAQGATEQQVVETGNTVKANMPNAVVASLNNDAQVSFVDTSTQMSQQVLGTATAAAVAAETEAQRAGFWDKAKATKRMGGLSSPTQAFGDWLELQAIPRDQKPFDWRANWESNLAGYSAEEQDYIINNGQGSERAWTAAQLIVERRRAAARVATGGGTASTVAASLFVGGLDPVSLVAFGGVGKVAQLGGISARGLATGGRGLAAVGASAVENVAAGLLVDGTLAAAGEHVTLDDMPKSVAMNAAFGAGFGLLHLPEAARAKVREAYTQAATQAAEREAAQWKAAQDNIGTGATPEQLRAEYDRLTIKAMEDNLAVSTAPVPSVRRILPEAVMDGTVPSLSPEQVSAKERLYGTHNMADDGERALATSYYEQADKVLANNTINLERLRGFLTNTGLLTKAGLKDTASTLLMSKNPLAQALGVVLTESASGAAQRGQTAALARSMHHRMFMGDFNTKYENAYRLWAREHGGSVIGDYLNGKHYQRFNRQVAELIEEQHHNGPAIEPGKYHPAVQAAARYQFEGMDRMRKTLQALDATGAARLGDSSFGYMTRTVSSSKVRALSEAQKDAIVDIYSKQFQKLSGWDAEFSEQHAKRVLEIHSNRALAGADMPLAIHDERMADIVTDALKAANLPPERVNELLGKFSRGGANFTKGRTELLLNAKYILKDGSEFSLMDIMDTDVPKLYRMYANRAAGEAALTQHGIQGKAGLDTLRTALQHGPDGKQITVAEMEAFDQVASEFLGQPFGSRIAAVDMANTLTSVLRLGGMGLTQMGETFNGIAHVGLARTLATIPQFGRLIREARLQVRGGVPKNPILHSIETLGGELGLEHYRKPIPFGDTEAVAISKQGGTEHYSRAEQALNAGAAAQAKLSFHSAIVTAQTRGMAEQIVGKAMKFIREGTELDGALKDMGFTETTVRALKADLPNIAKFGESGDLVALDLTKATDPVAAKEFIFAVNRGASQIIQSTFIGETGKWAHNSFLKMLLQFRTFGIISVEKQMARQAGVHGPAKALGYMLGAMAFAVPIQAARVALNTAGMSRSKAEEYRDRQLTPTALVRSSINYVSALGLSGDVVDALSGPLGFDNESHRGGGGKGLGGLVPAVGVGNDVIAAAGAVAGLSPLDDRRGRDVGSTLRKVIPLGRTPILIPVINALGND